MLQALLRGKLDKEFGGRSPFSIEDLLTAVVFGSCQYCSPKDDIGVVVSFLKKSINTYGCAETLEKDLVGVEGIEYLFWPEWKEELKICGKQVAPAEPDLLLTIKRKGCCDAFILIEVKLDSGKSSGSTEDPNKIEDQLAKYWFRLKRFAKDRGEPVAIIYLTADVSPPIEEIRETQRELSKLNEKAPLYWLSWRQFSAEPDSVQILRDVETLMAKKWVLFPIEPMKKSWPSLSAREMSDFLYRWSWAFASPTDREERCYTYTTAWKWPQCGEAILWKWSFMDAARKGVSNG